MEWNGMEWNGMEWNGMEWNGMEWNGMEWNGMEWEWNGMEWNGMEWNGMEWNGMEWNGMEWNGMEWNGMEWNVWAYGWVEVCAADAHPHALVMLMVSVALKSGSAFSPARRSATQTYQLFLTTKTDTGVNPPPIKRRRHRQTGLPRQGCIEFLWYTYRGVGSKKRASFPCNLRPLRRLPS